MSDIAIRVENLSKAYRIGLAEQRHETLMGAVTSFVKSPLSNFRNLRKLSKFDDIADIQKSQLSAFSPQPPAPSSPLPAPHTTSGLSPLASRPSPLASGLSPLATRPSPLASRLSPLASRPSPLASHPSDIIWALRDISFEVKHGEVLGIIGRNGAGKSTLLKILSRITEPTSGRATIYGRVGSLLEVGTGFHPDLTGRENVYLNGTILGMSKREVDRKFEAIVDFSGVATFIDTPVKRYSSGMKVRLAFAVAAHLEPEILIIDEVLAVGDVEFQRKCLGKIGSLASSGRTVLFVSHNLGSVETLCKRGVIMRRGRIVADTTSEEAVSLYLNTLDKSSAVAVSERSDRRGSGNVRVTSVEVAGDVVRNSTVLAVGRPASFTFGLSRWNPGISCRFTIYDLKGNALIRFNSSTPSKEDTADDTGGPAFRCEIDELTLAPGRYFINVALYRGNELEDHIEAAVFFNVEQGHLRGRIVSRSSGYGLICISHRWSHARP